MFFKNVQKGKVERGARHKFTYASRVVGSWQLLINSDDIKEMFSLSSPLSLVCSFMISFTRTYIQFVR